MENSLCFGTAGLPLSTPHRNFINGLNHLKKLGLDCLEIEFVRSVNISVDKTKEIKEIAERNQTILTCHAPYFINLNSSQPSVVEASKQRIINSARIAWLCGAQSLTFHAAYYQKDSPSLVFERVKQSIKEIVRTLQKENNFILIRPETTGKPVQWGSMEEIVQLSQELEQVQPCLDFAHLYTRSIGQVNQYPDFVRILAFIERELGQVALKKMHIHLSGILGGPKGERYHLPLKESEFNYLAVLKALKEFKCGGVVICESPLIEADALLMQKEYSLL